MRSHYCGDINETVNGEEVELCGWVNRRRDHGGVIFVDLRDNQGLVQVVFDPDDQATFSQAEQVRNEYVLQIRGRVRPRPEGTVNADLPSGQVEVLASALTILNTTENLPFTPDDHHNISEEVRLKYRYIDLRRQEMQERLVLRSKATQFLHEYLAKQQFVHVETPVLTKATPEGARDYLVPSRMHAGKFYALPQSPQIFKQLLMAAGVDKYYQIVKCFRDEDLRADRQPEFTQIDMEFSFVDEHAVQTFIETMICRLFSEVANIDLGEAFPRMSYAEAIARYGSDRPDLRNPLEFVDIDDLVVNAEFQVFRLAAEDKAGRVVALRLPEGCRLSRKQLDDYAEFVKIYGAKGLAYIKVNDRKLGRDGLQSPILKVLSDEILQAILERTQAESGDVIFFGADKARIVNDAMGALRNKLGHDCDLLTAKWCPLWVYDFPLFEDDNGRLSSVHHPFTAPKVQQGQSLRANAKQVLSRSYDLVLNGLELGGGSIRIHDYETQLEVLRLLGIESDQAWDQFGHLLSALRSGCPPHGGVAFGLDRIIMLMTASDSIRDVIAFPKTQSAACPLTQAPSRAELEQLLELHVRLVDKAQ